MEAGAMMAEAWKLTAAQAVEALRSGRLTPMDLLAAVSDRVSAVNPTVNALPTLCLARAEAQARQLSLKPPEARGLLAGLPLPIKDSYEVEGVRTTWGSLAYADHVAARSDYLVEAIEGQGGIVFAKSNTPEFEAGANTFNEVFGPTLNPWNTALSAGGSSGGAAVAVATGMAHIAQGSDFACSLRYPAAFCGIVGLRPSPGLIPQGPSRLPHQVLSVIGPLARNVEDAGLALDAMVAFDARDPLTRPTPRPGYQAAARQPWRPPAAAFSMDFGFARVSGAVADCVALAAGRLRAAGLDLREASLDLGAADPCFRTLRAFQFAAMRYDVLRDHRDRLKPEVVWNIEEGLKLTAGAIAAAEAERQVLRAAILRQFETCDVIVAPAAPVVPFPVGERYVTRIDGIEQKSYLDWLALGYAITVTGCPAIAIPCGQTRDGLPCAIQIVARPYREDALLAAARWCEAVLDCRMDMPIDPRGPSA
jgi:amidase